uniref:Alpha-macroglobulin receptor-binding domain-containing protein n=1 Tax=Eptatretus burgeri TaxID=7764 RepID=A0A8C4WVW6_EPTBU
MLTNGIEDVQALAIVTYALTLSGSTRSATALDKLNTFAIQKDGLMYWPKTGQPPTRQQHQSSSSIETAAYALLAHLKLGRKEQGLPIMRWLGQQRNSFGGFTSTQDTVVALEAMSFFAAQVSGGKPNLLVSISTSDMSSPSKFIINENNLLVLHKTEVPVSQQHKTLVVNVQGSGAGVAFIQLNVMYNIIPIPIKHVQEEAYEMNVIMKDNVEVSDHYSITICTSRKDEEKGGMVVMEVYLLSGFSLDDNFEKPRIARLMEVENGKVILYFDEIQEEICITISATRVVPVSQIKSACVIVYEYYHLELRAERVYNSPKIM